MADANDYRQVLTERLIEQLEAGTAPWQKPWDARDGALRLPWNLTTDRPYRGANSLYLSSIAWQKGYADSRWATYRQAAEEGWQVRRGEKGSLIEYWKFPDRPDEAQSTGSAREPEVRRKPQVFRAVVFNAQQIEGVPELTMTARRYDWDPIESAERILRASGVKLVHDQTDRAFYHVGRDEIHLPGRGQFRDQAGYYATALHETGHATGHSSRLNRNLSGGFGSADYAKEELRAELASYFMADRLGVPHEPGQHAAYVKSWIQALREDRNEIFRAARDAEKITEYVLGLDRQRGHAGERVGERSEAPVSGPAHTAADPAKAVHLAALGETLRAQGFSEQSVAKVQARASGMLDRFSEQGVGVPAPRVFDVHARGPRAADRAIDAAHPAAAATSLTLER